MSDLDSETRRDQTRRTGSPSEPVGVYNESDTATPEGTVNVYDRPERSGSPLSPVMIVLLVIVLALLAVAAYTWVF
jgi:hypothetical protein